MSQLPLVRPDGRLLPVWGFLTFHRALRRDAARFVERFAAPGDNDPLGAVDVDALGAHWQRYRELLAFHHENEDQFLLPLMRAEHPHLAPLLDQLAGEHVALDALLERLDHDLARLPQADAVDRARAGCEELHAVLGPHLRAEEEHLVPRMLEYLARAGPSTDEVGDIDFGSTPVEFGLPWIADGLDPAELDLVLASLPPERRAQHPDARASYERARARWLAPARTEVRTAATPTLCGRRDRRRSEPRPSTRGRDR